MTSFSGCVAVSHLMLWTCGRTSFTGSIATSMPVPAVAEPSASVNDVGCWRSDGRGVLDGAESWIVTSVNTDVVQNDVPAACFSERRAEVHREGVLQGRCRRTIRRCQAVRWRSSLDRWFSPVTAQPLASARLIASVSSVMPSPRAPWVLRVVWHAGSVPLRKRVQGAGLRPGRRQ